MRDFMLSDEAIVHNHKTVRDAFDEIVDMFARIRLNLDVRNRGPEEELSTWLAMHQVLGHAVGFAEMLIEKATTQDPDNTMSMEELNEATRHHREDAIESGKRLANKESTEVS
jgi:hypothetical protein